ncbi:MAG: ATP-dependent dethiobiotin synthetase BioD [Magnetovibrio sp.]|nr:ATP-dependent dethiobiotin synthetase BioD [Magnetovibrio sp.]
MTRLIISGTDTDVGKTVVAAMLTLALGARYFKPVQCGTQPETDTQAVIRMTGLSTDRVLAEAVVLSHPLSPHRAAELDGVSIDVQSLTPPAGPVIVEGAGGLMVPVTRHMLFIDLFAAWNLPLVLVARTGLGTLNHTLLSLKALQSMNVAICGIVFVGDENLDNMRTISEMSGVKVLGRVPMMKQINANTLKQVFERNFNINDFELFK